MSHCSLSDALSFEAPAVVLQFKEKSGFTAEDCESIFTETKRWLWACARRAEDEKNGKSVPLSLLISPELTVMDGMWHCFLSSEKMYNDFCNGTLGSFVEHIPMTEDQIRKFDKLRSKNPEAALLLRQQEIRPQLDYLYDLVGPDVIRRWYLEFPARFGMESIPE